MNPDTFRKGIEVYAAQITGELLQVQVSVSDGGHIPCPKCRTGRILFYPKVAKCSNVDCPLTVFRNKGERQLTDHQITDLLTKGKTALIKGFKSKEGKSFDACVTFDKDFRTVYEFPPHVGKAKGKEGRRAMNGIGWLTVAEAARLCGTDELRITLWMNGNHIAYARFDDILMIDGSSLAALFGRHRVATIYDEVPRERGKLGRPGRLHRLLDTPLDTFGLSQRIVRACRELGIFTVEHLLVHLRRFRFSRLSCVRNFGSGSATETLRRLRQDGLIDNGTPRDFKVLYP
ncbi:topoisomerase C-terminal repeat-containing protein [Bacteroides helcogenes]|uniref:topoisomerase C-terminal repeat-containing protein n=1 Tax=Bacteroides helcogenes TaxID=290053 RepID=UPI002A919BF9|nr:topoisomerase C-terminal repeat-containing protein [Bacteroides helcogenes]MDY5237960.1 topoisomerase C-terminal repeat-containing protein [Bacteroides helcogenes]